MRLEETLELQAVPLVKYRWCRLEPFDLAQDKLRREIFLDPIVS